MLIKKSITYIYYSLVLNIIFTKLIYKIGYKITNYLIIYTKSLISMPLNLEIILTCQLINILQIITNVSY